MSAGGFAGPTARGEFCFGLQTAARPARPVAKRSSTCDPCLAAARRPAVVALVGGAPGLDHRRWRWSGYGSGRQQHRATRGRRKMPSDRVL